MSHEFATVARKKVLAWVLLGLMMLSMGTTGRWLHRESTQICATLYEEPAMMGQETLPCRSWTRGGDGALLSETRFTYHRDGQSLARLETRSGDAVEVIDCSFVGKLLLPFRHPETWLSHGVSVAMREAIEVRDEARGAYDEVQKMGLVKDEQGIVEQVETIRRDGDGGLEWREVRRYEGRGLLVERVHVMGQGEHVRKTWRHEFDEEGNVRRRDIENVIYDTATITAVTYDYRCDEGGFEARFED